MTEEEWLPDMYNKCIEALHEFSELEELTEEEIGMRNLCHTIVYMFNRLKLEDMSVPEDTTVH